MSYLKRRSINRSKQRPKNQGKADKYIPGIRVKDIPSNGTCVRTPGWHSKRMHHLLSLLEYSFFLMLECMKYVIEIREQFELDQEVTIRLAEKMGIRHPRKPYTSLFSTMTTDFYVKFRKGNHTWYEAFSVKPKYFLHDRRIMEKLRLEAAYWRSRNTPFHVITEKEMNKIIIRNMRLIHNRRSPKGLGIDPVLFDKAVALLNERIHQRDKCLREITKPCDIELGFPLGRCMKIAFHLIASGQWQADLTKPISPFKPLQLKMQ